MKCQMCFAQNILQLSNALKEKIKTNCEYDLIKNQSNLLNLQNQIEIEHSNYLEFQ